VGPSKIARPDGWKREPRMGPFVERPVDWKYTDDDRERIRWGFVPREMEDRWLMVAEGEQLFVHRSWTGVLCCVAHLSPDGIARLEIAPGPEGAVRRPGVHPVPDRGDADRDLNPGSIEISRSAH
jgi:hypothetical protein